MRDNDNDTMSPLGCIVMVAAMLLSIPLRGLTLVVLWRWFLVPPFGLPDLSIPYALGLSLLVNTLIVQRVDWKQAGKKTKGELIAEAVYPWVQCGLVLLVGWIVLQFV